MKARLLLLAAAAALLGANFAAAQDVVSVGKGSYASFPPSDAGGKIQDFVDRKDWYIVDRGDRALPTNKWWTNLLVQGKGDLWTYPLCTQVKDNNVNIFFPTEWKGDGGIEKGTPLTVNGDTMNPADVRVKDWSDWMITFRQAESPDKYIDYTIGEGMPYVWAEFKGCKPKLEVGLGATLFSESGAANSPVTGDAIGVEIDGHKFGIYAPDGSTFKQDGQSLLIDNDAGVPYVVICPLNDAKDLATYHAHAFAIPRNTVLTWAYDPIAGNVKTTWTVTTDCLKGTDHSIIQGWLPHQYRNTETDLKLTGIDYRCPRGTLKTAVGSAFNITFPFGGFAPYTPAPKPSGLEHDFKPDRMKQYLAEQADKTKYGDDTYWGGKDFLQKGHYMEMAREMGDPVADTLQSQLHDELVDWLTYTPGERAHYFAKYPNWHALIGVKSSYGSDEFNDNHFHYGYMTFAAAKLGFVDPQFLVDYGPMIKLVAKEYGNWDRNNKDFPLFRCYDLWAGHCWAGGTSSEGGENEESSSEDAQSCVGLYMLGTALNDPDITAAGAMEYSMEKAAIMEYWFNQFGDNFPPGYSHPIEGMVWSGGQVYGTYFSGDPAWIFSIQWLPWSPGLGYLVNDPKFAKDKFDQMVAQRMEREKKNPEIEKAGDGLGGVIYTYEAQFDPDTVAAKLDEFWDDKNPIAHNDSTGGMTYFWTHASRMLGDVVFDTHLSVPTSGVYKNRTNGALTYVAYNPRSVAQLAEVFKGKNLVGRLLLPPGKLTVTTSLLSAKSMGGVLGVMPADQSPGVSRTLTHIDVVFEGPADPASLAGVTLTGPEDPKLTPSIAGDGRVASFTLSGPLRPGGAYTLNLPRTVKLTSGTMITPQTSKFTVEKEPALAIESSDPAAGAAKVPVDQKSITVTFNDAVTQAALSAVRLTGKGVNGLTPKPLAADGRTATFTVRGAFLPDTAYEILVPPLVKSRYGTTPAAAIKVDFSTGPMPCPPNVYTESFAGNGYHADKELTVDLRSTDGPHSGKFCIKLSAPGDREGSISFFAGTDDRDGRKPIGTDKYAALEFYMKSTSPAVWLHIGSPSQDHAFMQTQQKGVTSEWQKFRLELPDPKTEINTLLTVSVPAHETVQLDDIQFVEQ